MKTIEERLTALEATVAAMRASAPASTPLEVDLASDRFADFAIRKCPPKWLESGGPDYAGRTISETTPEFCDALASFLDWQAARDEAKNYSYTNQKGDVVFPAKFARKDAARARAWAKKLRADSPRAFEPLHASGEIPF
jgi:hypothetical protein